MTPNYIKLVKDFHNMTGDCWLENPEIPHADRARLRINLITEEAYEFIAAINNHNLVEAADGLIDLLYVTLGSLGELGLGNITNELFMEVHNSNMSKLCKSELVAKKTVDYYRDAEPPTKCEAAYRKMGSYFLVYRVSDNKSLKSLDYKPANLANIIIQEVEKNKPQRM